MNKEKKIPLMSVVLFTLLSALIIVSLFSNIRNRTVYYLYAIVCFAVFLANVFIRRYYKRFKKVDEYLVGAEKYLLFAGGTFVIGIIALALKTYFLLYLVIFLGAFSASVGFLKIIVFNTRGLIR